MSQQTLSDRLEAFYDLSGKKMPKAIENRIARNADLRGIEKEIAALVKEKEAAVSEAQAKSLADDALALIDARAKGAKVETLFEKLGPDAHALAIEEKDKALRFRKIHRTAREGAEADLLGEVLSPEFAKTLKAVWADFVGPQEWADTVTLREVKEHEAKGSELFGLIVDFSVSIARHDGADAKEIKELRGLLNAKPERLPTLADVDSRRKRAREATPNALAEKARQERKAKEAKANAAYAKEAARMRIEAIRGPSVEAADTDEAVEASAQ